MKKLMSFDNFNSNWKNIKEGVDDGIEEIVPEGLPGLPENENNVIEEIKDFLDSEPDDDVIEALVNELRDVLLEMEQQGFVEDNFTDELDDKYEDDWKSWILEVIELPEFPEEGLNRIMEVINNIDTLEFGQIGSDEDEFDDEDFEDDSESDDEFDDEDFEEDIKK